MMSSTVRVIVSVPLGRIAMILSFDGSSSGRKKIAVFATSQAEFSVMLIVTDPVVVFGWASMPGAVRAPT